MACDARVQGEWAAEMVAAALRTLAGPAAGLDLILVVRGGGARADLATFDAEAVARAIAECPCRCMTGLGHEVDRSVADEVAQPRPQDADRLRGGGGSAGPRLPAERGTCLDGRGRAAVAQIGPG